MAAWESAPLVTGGGWQSAPLVNEPPQQPGSAPTAVGDTLVSPEDQARINEPPANPPVSSLEDLRNRVQQGEIGVLRSMAPTPDDNALLRYGKYAAMTGLHGVTQLGLAPLNALIGLGQGTGAVTINPETGGLGLTPEAQTAASFAANPLRFSSRPAPVPEPTPAPGAALAAPQPVGAQVTPQFEPLFTPREEAAYRATAAGNKLVENQIIGEPDYNQYIPGVRPDNVELEQTVQAARDKKALGIETPEASDLAKLAAQRNNEARREYSLNTERTPVDIANREAQRQADIDAQSQAVFAPGNVKGDVSMQPLIDQMRAEVNVPRNRQNTALQSEFGDLIKRLTDKDGNALTMGPEEAWGLRQDIDRMTDKMATTGTDAQARNRARVAGNLNRVSDTLDQGIEAVAPGYSDMLATYREHSKAIREMEVLQGLTGRLSQGPNGNLSYSAMQRFMKNVVDSQSTGTQDLNPYKSISPETMQRLWNLRDDLRRSAGALELARAAGSDTTQNIMDVLRRWGGVGAQGAAHMGAAHLFGPAGPIMLRMIQEARAPGVAARQTQRNVEQMRQILNPPTQLRLPPGQEPNDLLRP